MTMRSLYFSLVSMTVAAAAAAQGRPDLQTSKVLPAGRTVSVGNINGNVKVTPSSTGKVEIVAYRHGSGNDEMHADVVDTRDGVEICVVFYAGAHCGDDNRGRNNRRRDNRDDAQIDFDIQVPTNLIVRANSVSGDVDVRGAHGQVTAGSVSGDVSLSGLQASSINATSVSGDVNVQVDSFTGTDALKFNSVSGNVTLSLPRALDADVLLSTVSGDFDSDFQMTLASGRLRSRSLSARIGAGGRPITVSTVSGDLRLRANK